jgi:hypothetical protein
MKNAAFAPKVKLKRVSVRRSGCHARSAKPADDMIEHRRVERVVELHAGLPVPHPSYPAVDRLHVRNAKTDCFTSLDPNWWRDAATLRREVEKFDPVARIAMAFEFDVAVEWYSIALARVCHPKPFSLAAG